jgi:uncharacterized DUF497 family protein
MAEFEWDEQRAISNLQKHGVAFADAVSAVEDDPLALTIPDDFPGEGRFVTIGTDLLGRTLVVVYVWRGNRARIISARKATPRERRAYEGKE